MNIKKILSVFVILFSVGVFAQGENMENKKEQIKSLKVAFLTTELNLSKTEAEKFWPVYNAYDDKQFEIRNKRMKSYMSSMRDESLSKMSEKDANILVAQMENSDEELFYLKKNFIKKLRVILPAVKIIKLKKSEDDFNRKLLHQYRNNKR